MKKGGILFITIILVLTLAFSGVLKADEVSDVNRAYACLNEKIDATNCSQLSTEEKAFSLLATGKCKTELLGDSFNETCWPAANCNIEMTAKAVLALDSVDVNTSLAVDWLKGKKGISTDLNWYLQIDSNGVLLCNAGYEVNGIFTTYEFEIGEDKEISANAGSCLTRANNNYWFGISPNCYDKQFQVSCNESFISTLLYREQNSQTYNILNNVQSSSGGITIEKIDSYCLLKNDGSCDYLGTSWTSVIFDFLGQNTSEYLPYLITTAPNHISAFPDAFLYILTNSLEFKTNILSKQILNEYWQIPGGRGKYYDTALAMLPFQGVGELTEKTNTKNWLFNVQQPNGCWDNDNVLTNSFLLYALWPQENSGGGGEIFCTDLDYTCVENASECTGTIHGEYECGNDQICCNPEGGGGELTECELEGYTCGFASACTGELLPQFSCGPTIQKCCDTTPVITTCSDLNGIVCSNAEYCSGGSSVSTDDLNYGETCCIGGSCEISTGTFTCETNGGLCDSSCPSGYETVGEYTCSNSQDFCCMQTQSSGTSYWWIWVLFFLVLAVVVAILYRDKLKEFIQKMKARRSGSGGAPGSRPGGPRGPPPRFPPSYNRMPRMGAPVPRKIIPSEQNRPPVQKVQPKPKPSGEIDEVLKKLKEMGR